MKNIFLSRIRKFVVLLFPIVFICLFAQNYLLGYDDHNTRRVHDFYNEEENSLDVVFIGASEVFTGFSPAYAFHQFGFTSYMYSVNSNPGSLYKSQLKEILSRQNPQLIFVEVNGFLYDDAAMMKDESTLRMYIENIPMSFNKLDTIFRYQYSDKLSMLFPFIKYHGDWQDGNALDLRYFQKTNANNDPSYLKGIVTETFVDDHAPVYEVPYDDNGWTITEMSKEYLIDFLKYCKSEQLDNIVFVRFPHKLDNYNSYIRANLANNVGSIVEQYGFEYLNLDQKMEDMNIDYLNDFYNPEHLNIYGQIKLTDYLGNLIVSKYNVIPIQQTQTNTMHWEKSGLYSCAYNVYADSCIKQGVDLWITEQQNLFSELDKIVESF